jgi:hypothetical protein
MSKTGLKKMDLLTVLSKFGILKINTYPSAQTTKTFIDLLRPVILANSVSEVLHPAAAPIFHFGLRWGRKKPENPSITPALNTKPIANHPYNADKYVYSKLDHLSRPLPPLSYLQPIISEIEKALDINMQHYDCVIGNVYLKGLYIPPHADTSESKSAQHYPVIVYTIGNDSALGIWNDIGMHPVEYEYDCYPIPNQEGPNNEILTQNGTIYAFGVNGIGRFEMIHATPCNNNPKEAFPEIHLPTNDLIRDELKGVTTSYYTITLTFRRAQEVVSPIPETPY